ncbi:MAG TPA: FAD-dependent oxidoreductase [Candidatus Eremiobacteraeota bacterium]|nr:FAD-dependent oxidoreductase [Candidatus Eremiobacteraeota bacterium]
MKYVIIGNGAAGSSAAAKIRKLDKEGIIDVFTTENVPYYYRPKLIDYLAKDVPFEKCILSGEKWFSHNKINLYLNTEVTSIVPEKNEITTKDGRVFAYDRLLIAVGANCFVPPIKGVDSPKVFTVKNKVDADTIMSLAEKSKSAILVGGGLLGLETGNSLRKLGLKVRVVEFFPRLLPRQLDVEGADILEKQLTSMGFEFYLGKVSENIDGSAASMKLTLKTGEILEGDMIIISAGIRPDLKLATEAGIKVNKGILVDNYMKTSVDNIYASGDVIEHDGRLYGIWQPAKEQGEIAGENMVKPGSKEYKGTLLSHKLKVVGIDLLSMGDIDGDGKMKVVVHKDEKAFIYKKAVISSDKLIGCIMLGNIEGEKQISRTITEGTSFEEVKKYFHL